MCYGISALLVYRLPAAWWLSVLVWLALSFVLGVFYAFFLLMFFPAPSLELCYDQDFQALDLNK
jgi:hypothetical protein